MLNSTMPVSGASRNFEIIISINRSFMHTGKKFVKNEKRFVKAVAVNDRAAGSFVKAVATNERAARSFVKTVIRNYKAVGSFVKAVAVNGRAVGSFDHTPGPSPKERGGKPHQLCIFLAGSGE